jgi:hypothetical protein
MFEKLTLPLFGFLVDEITPGFSSMFDTKQLRIEFPPEGDGVTTKTPDDFVTVLLKDGTLVHYTAPTTPLNNQV